MFLPLHVFSGQTVSQAIVSAQRTVDASKYSIHSLHSYFLRAGDDDSGILYYVDNLKDSPSFCARRVVAVQAGVPIFTCAVNFCSREKVPLEHQLPMPDVPHPDALPLINTQMRELAQDARLPLRTRKMLARSAVQPIPFDIKWTDDFDGSWDAWSSTPPLRAPHRRVWMRVRGRLPNQQTVHHVALAYLSDWGIIGVATKAHGLVSFDPNVKPSSLDHTIYFHDPDFRADEWLLYDVICERMKGSRCLLIGKVFTQQGVHVVTVIQEALVRVRDPVSAASSPSPVIAKLLKDPQSTLGAAAAAAANSNADASSNSSGVSGGGSKGDGSKAKGKGEGEYGVSASVVRRLPDAATVESIMPHATARFGDALASEGTRASIERLRLAAVESEDSKGAQDFETEQKQKQTQTQTADPVAAAAAAAAGSAQSQSASSSAEAGVQNAVTGGTYTPSSLRDLRFAPSLPLNTPHGGNSNSNGNGSGSGNSGNGSGSSGAKRLASNGTAAAPGAATYSAGPVDMPSQLSRSGPHPWDKPIIVALL